jgi:hypothetical protein
MNGTGVRLLKQQFPGFFLNNILYQHVFKYSEEF